MTSQNNDKIVLGLDIPKTAAQINTDLKKVEKRLSGIRLSGTLDDSLKDTDQTLKSTENSMHMLDKLGASFRSQMAQASESLSKCLSLDTVVNRFISKTQNTIKELKQIDTLLTQISVSNERLSRPDLERIGNNAISIAGKYDGSAAAKERKIDADGLASGMVSDTKNAGRGKRPPFLSNMPVTVCVPVQRTGFAYCSL